MNGNRYLADTNILLYIIAGNDSVYDFINDEFYISEVSEIELLGNKEFLYFNLNIVKKLLKIALWFVMSENIKRLTIQLKQTYTLKIPDAIIAATAIYLKLPLLTADKDFKKIKELDLLLIQPL